MYPTTFFIHEGSIYRKFAPRSSMMVTRAEAQNMLDANALDASAMESLTAAVAEYDALTPQS